MHDLLPSSNEPDHSDGTSIELPGYPGTSDLHGVRPPDRLVLAYAELLGRVPWHWFCTLTFRPHLVSGTGGVHPERADKAFRLFISKINRELYGANWSRRHHQGLMWARGSEFHKDGRLHFHAVVSAHGNDLNILTKRYDWHEYWYKEFGRNQIEAPRSQDEITHYVSKYVTKGGVVDFSPNFSAWMPPSRDFTSPGHTGNLIPDQR